MKKLILPVVALILTSCSAMLSPDSKFVKKALAERTNQGQVVFESKCGKCHDLPTASNFSAEEWKTILVRMQPKAKITDEQREAIYAYLVLN